MSITQIFTSRGSFITRIKTDLPSLILCVTFCFCQANISDYTNNQWVTCFQETAEAILGQNAAYLGQLKESVRRFFGALIRCLKFHLLEKGCVCFQNEAAFDEIFQKANFSTFVFRNRVKLETYNVSTAGSGDVYQLLDSYCRILDDVILGKRN